jgi:FemAB family
MVTLPLVEATFSSRATARVLEAEPVDYQVWVTGGPNDAQWDAFVASTPGGHHAQTSRWAQLKETIGWRAVRVAVTEEAIAAAARRAAK